MYKTDLDMHDIIDLVLIKVMKNIKSRRIIIHNVLNNLRLQMKINLYIKDNDLISSIVLKLLYKNFTLYK